MASQSNQNSGGAPISKRQAERGLPQGIYDSDLGDDTAPAPVAQPKSGQESLTVNSPTSIGPSGADSSSLFAKFLGQDSAQNAGFSRAPQSLFRNHEYSALYDSDGNFAGMYDGKQAAQPIENEGALTRVRLNSVDDIRNLIATQKLNAILETPFAPMSYAPTSAGDIAQLADRLMGTLNPVRRGTYDSTTEVYIAGDLKDTFDSRSIPSDQRKFATVQPGFYIAEHHMHQGRYDALQVVNASIDMDGQVTMAQDVSSAKDLGNRAIPTEGTNPAHPNQSFATGINIHHAGIDDFTGVTRTGTGVSEGCQVVATHEWDSFMSIVAAKTNGHYNVPYFNTWIVRGH